MSKQKIIVVATLLLVALAFGAGVYFFGQGKAKEQAGVAVSQAGQVMRADAARFGSAEAKVTIVEFFDPACEACRAFYAPVKQIVTTSFGRVSLVLRYAPLHKDSDKAAMMLEATRAQDKYWQAVEAALASQDRWASHDRPDLNQLWPALQAAGVDIERVRADMNSDAVRNALGQDVAALSALKVQRTPTFYVNGKPLVNFGLDQLKELVAREVAVSYAN
ncbi:MAG: thioredoxin domain-containing protein [Pseudomonadota bacterium]